MLATFTSITSVLWEKMNEGGVFCGNKVWIMHFVFFLLFLTFISVFVSLGFLF